MIGFLQICLTTTFLCLRSYHVFGASGPGGLAMKYVAFNASYIVSGDTSVDQNCAWHYGHTFLYKMTREARNLSNTCRTHGTRDFQVEVKVVPKVTAIVVETTEGEKVITIVSNLGVEIKSTRKGEYIPVDRRNATSIACASTLRDNLDKTNPLLVVETLEQNKTLGCAIAKIQAPKHMVFWKESWECPEGLQVEFSNLTCIEISVTTPAPNCQTCVESALKLNLPDAAESDCTMNETQSALRCANKGFHEANITVCSRKKTDFHKLVCGSLTTSGYAAQTSPSTVDGGFESTSVFLGSTRGPYQSSPISSAPTSDPGAVSTTQGVFSTVDPNVDMSTLPPDGAATIEVSNFQTSHLVLEEGEDYQEVNVTFVTKDSLCGGRRDKCELFATIEIDSPDGPRCQLNSKSIAKVVVGPFRDAAAGNFCRIPLTQSQNRKSIRLPLKAKLDGKNSQKQVVNATVTIHRRTSVETTEKVASEYFEITVQDNDAKAICQSVNDPHIGTFDGLEYNNFYEGEFVLYKNTKLPYEVHVIYQKCGPGIDATCNCGAAVQSGDDVIVFDKCRRKRKLLKRLDGKPAKHMTALRVTLFLNNQLTPGTKIFQANDGKLYYVMLPHGAVVVVRVNEDLLNVWVMGSPADRHNTRGLCGSYDGNRENDAMYDNETIMKVPKSTDRWQPNDFSTHWRVDLGSDKSIYEGVKENPSDYKPVRYCECPSDPSLQPRCDYAMDVEICDKYEGVDITQELVANALRPMVGLRRRKRGTTTLNPIYQDPIVIDKQYIPPSWNWDWPGNWTRQEAVQSCEDYLKHKYQVGRTCSSLPGVNYEQELRTCIEDIKLTGTTSWQSSALDAMKEQCMQEVRRNTTLPASIAQNIKDNMCPNQCSDHGRCEKGKCVCDTYYSSEDCSVNMNEAPYLSELTNYGLCNVRESSCNTTRVFGLPFVKSKNLKCQMQPVELDDKGYKILRSEPKVTTDAQFVNYNTVDCPVPSDKKVLVRVANNNVNFSGPLMFVPYNPLCFECSTNTTTCYRVLSACELDGRCFEEGDLMPGDNCKVCKGQQWRTREEPNCNNRDVLIFGIVGGAVGALIGLVLGILIYKFCCKRKRPPEESTWRGTMDDLPDRPVDYRLHRNRNLPEFDNIEEDLPFPPAPRQPPLNHWCGGEGRGVENGVDDTTYF